MFLYKNLFFFNIFCYFNPNHAYWNQRRLFSGNLPGMFCVETHMFYVRRDNPAMTGMLTDASWVRGWGASIDVPGGPCVQKGHYVAVGVQCVPRRTNRR